MDTFKAALRFEKSVQGYSEITNCAVHNGLGWAVNIKSAANILLKNNNFFNFRPVGVGIEGARNITVDGNVLLHVVEREVTGDYIDKRGGFLMCTYND
jgi:hypothetical protein